MLSLQHMNMRAMYTTLTTFYNKLTLYKHMMVMGTGQSTDACAGAVHVTYVKCIIWVELWVCCKDALVIKSIAWGGANA